MSKEELSEVKIFIKAKLVIKLSYSLYYLFMLHLLFLSISIECKQRIIQFNDSNITIYLKPGRNHILSNDYNNLPYKIYMNGRFIRGLTVINGLLMFGNDYFYPSIECSMNFNLCVGNSLK